MNTKHPLYKEKLRLENRSAELYKIKRNQNWIKLENPYINGYYKCFDLRDDIKNRDDAWVFYACIELVGGEVWCKNKTFKRKTSKGKYEYIRPGFGEISEELYNRLVPAVKKYFSEIPIYSKRWNPFRKKYECNVPSYYFVEKSKPCWVTHYKEHNELIEQEDAEIDAILWSGKFRPINPRFGRDRGGLSDLAQCYNSADRSCNKQALKRNISQGEDYDSVEYRYNHRHSAIWEYW